MTSSFKVLPVIAAAAAVGLVSVLLGPTAAVAQQRAPAQQAQPSGSYELPPVGTAIVVVDNGKILREAQAVQAIRAQIEKQRSAYQAQLQKQENELRNADQELAKQRSILSPEAFAQRRRELERRVSEAQEAVQDRRRAFDQGYNAAMQKVNDAMVQIIGELLVERNYQIVLNKQMVIAQPKLDITPEVMRRLNRKLPSVTVSISQK